MRTCSLSALSRMRSAKRRAVSGSSAAPSVSTSAEARTEAIGFFSSCERSATKFSSAWRCSSSRRIDSSASVSSRTSRPRGRGSAACLSPEATRCAARVSRSMGPATAWPMSTATTADASARMKARSATFGATSFISATMPKVALRTRTNPWSRMGALATTICTPGRSCASPTATTVRPCASTISTCVAISLCVNAGRTRESCCAAWTRSPPAASSSREASSARTRASSWAPRWANTEARAVNRSMTMTAKAAESVSVVAARGRKTWRRKERPLRRAATSREMVRARPTRKTSASRARRPCLPSVTARPSAGIPLRAPSPGASDRRPLPPACGAAP